MGTLIDQHVRFYQDTVGIDQGQPVIRSTRLVRFTFKVQHLYKGRVQQDTVSISTSAGDADCGYVFSAGQSYLVYSWRTDALPNDFRKDYRRVTPYLTTSICSRTRPRQYLPFYERTVLRLL
ncbi:hypothetical protein EJV47_03280 [Hymenobacter gummosus]|uniref:Uncharacterized protein n=1 Tax=Hymenobacter gummosus TaxID=1776032 RepID=A0A431U9J1_9BACT|nr:hypothetical protein [Hymenobacter gummosus]RTQ53770.1 hypothetical protein EJV47_03280 [Hymenobacter gummosus]